MPYRADMHPDARQESEKLRGLTGRIGQSNFESAANAYAKLMAHFLGKDAPAPATEHLAQHARRRLAEAHGFAIYSIVGKRPPSEFLVDVAPLWVFFAVKDDILLVMAWAEGTTEALERATQLAKSRLENWQDWAHPEYV